MRMLRGVLQDPEVPSPSTESPFEDRNAHLATGTVRAVPYGTFLHHSMHVVRTYSSSVESTIMLGLLLLWMLPGLNGLHTGGVHHDEFLSWQRSFGKQDEYVRLNKSDLNSRFAGKVLPSATRLGT